MSNDTLKDTRTDQTYNIPAEIAMALAADRPELIKVYINRSKPGPTVEMARLVMDLITDRINDRQRIGMLSAAVEVLKEHSAKAIKVLKGTTDLGNQES